MNADAHSRTQYRHVAADLHTHSIGDGRYDDRSRDLIMRHVNAAVATGLQVLGVTDHDDLRPGRIAADYALANGLPILVIPGMEVTTSDGHLVALGLSESLKPWQSMTETIHAARQQHAIVILPHPFFPALRARTDVDAMERLNFRYGDFDVDRTDIAVIASSDAHSPTDLSDNPYRTILQVQDLSWAGVAEAIRAGRSTIVQHDEAMRHTA